MSESDMRGQKRSRVGRRGTEDRQNAVNDATPHIQSPTTVREIGREVGKEKAKGKVAGRGNGLRRVRGQTA